MSKKTKLAAAVAGVVAGTAMILPAAWAGSPADTPTGEDRTRAGALQEVWRADFDGPAGALPPSSDWIIDTGTSYPGGPANWGTGETQTYTNDPANVSQDGQGNLRITPLKDGSGQWTSARIETRRTDFAAPEGGTMRIEARIRMPDITGEEALGYWPAFWTLGADFRGDYWNWPGIGEFDIMENVNGLNTVWGVLHCGTAPGGPCNEYDGRGGSTTCPGASCQSGFHTFALELDRTGSTEYLRWYVDGQHYHTVSSADLDAATWANATHHGHFVLLNVAMGGAFPDGVAGHATPTAATRPGVPMIVDYVSVQQSG
ncbi:family 16 glycosylhydrolase [Streptomyces sp. WAC 00631]|uniref:glycoside hydrolase family 16 protein n=1 Tax=unclassified Streptomyces TaxID=2593676 RepID=UPI000F7784B0|nr:MULTISPECIES: glycoside hydrolase family 16 protein [unclassified Streptomyces]MCC5034308.1 family 16 glycosylhydrolase [Streptomyces sp. WAC 00631]MCC9742314.1 family 16 glycosylhydrolase [Streptomyces sp. MNU89]